MTECPVCQNAEINKDIRLCPMCGIDLEIYKLIEKEEKELKKTKKMSKLSFSISIVLFLILAGSISFLINNKSLIIPSITSDKNPEMQVIMKENQRYKNEIKQLNNKIEEMNKTSLQTDNQNQNSTDLPIMTASLQTASTANTNETPPDKTTISKSSNYKIHLVKEGETAYGISRMYYGDGAKYTKLIKDNNLKDATFITAGAELKIYGSE